MKRTLLFFVIPLFCPGPVHSQLYESGLPFIRNYAPLETGGSEQNWAVVKDRRGIMYFGNNDRGVLEYDGVNWRSIPVSNHSIVRSLALGEDGRIYAGAVGELGVLLPGMNGALEYQSLLEGTDTSFLAFSDVWKTHAGDGIIWFCSSEITFRYDTAENKLTPIPNREGTFMSHLVGDVLYHSNALEGLLIQSGDEQVPAPGGAKLKQIFITGMLPWKDSKILIISGRSGVWVYDPASGRINSELPDRGLQDFLKNNVAYNAISLGKNGYAISTLYGGVILVDRTGRIYQKLDKSAGLQDETVLSAYYDTENPDGSPLWLTLNIGISKAEINSPLRYFDDKSGLEGTINDVTRFNQKLYVATSSGVFVQDKLNGLVHFRKIPELDTQCWSLAEIRRPGSNSGSLFVVTISGLYELHGTSEPVLIDKKVRNNPSGRIYYLYTYATSPKDKSLLYLGGRSLIILKFYSDRVEQIYERDFSNEIRSIAEDQKGDIWLTTGISGVASVSISGSDTIISLYGTDSGLPSEHDNFVYRLQDELFFATTKGVYEFKDSSDRFVPGSKFAGSGELSSFEIYRMMKDGSGNFWLSYEFEGHYGDLLMGKETDGYREYYEPFRRLPNKSTDVYFEDDSVIWIGKSTELYRFQRGFTKDYQSAFNAHIRLVSLGEDSIIYMGAGPQRDVEVPYSNNDFMFRVSSSFFEDEYATEYRYRLEGTDDDWSRWTNRTEYMLPNLSPGQYDFRVEARNIYGTISKGDSFSFIILPPWYRTLLAYFMYLILLVLLIAGIVVLYTRRLLRKNIILEGIIQRRTAEIRKQKEELTDSIKYASRIQQALLPSRVVLNDNLPDHFVFFLPRDIVSGDFYWMTREGDKVFVVAADCTGHGVPGAFMSMLGISFLNELVSKDGITQADKILNELRNHVISALKQTGEDEDETKDGMDISICVFDLAEKKIQYAGAYNPLHKVRPLSAEEKSLLKKNKNLDVEKGVVYNEKYILEPLKPDRMPVGISANRAQPFTLNEIDWVEGQTIYLHSDGYQDQFGGSRNKKLTVKGFKKWILEMQDEPMHRQKQILESNLREWMGSNAQVDDIIIIGIRV